jgi:hypothetical protein
LSDDPGGVVFANVPVDGLTVSRVIVYLQLSFLFEFSFKSMVSTLVGTVLSELANMVIIRDFLFYTKK